MELRDYQHILINQTRDLMRQGVRSILLQAPTGAGKTVLTAFMLSSAAQKQMGSLFIVHRIELIKQTMDTFKNIGLPFGVISAGYPEHENDCLTQIAGIQTLIRRTHKLKQPKLVIWDESHHCAAGTYENIRRSLPHSFHIGITATPERLDGRGLDKYFDKLIVGPSVMDLIRDEYLSQYKLFAPSQPDVSSLRIKMGDYANDDITNLMDKPTITGNAISEYKKRCLGKRAVVFCCSIKHSQHVTAEFNAAGIKAEHIDGETEKELRLAAMDRFREGKTLVISSVNLFIEGLDIPSMECAILLRPTQSLTIYLQSIGRALRPFDGKEYAVILDHAGNCHRHGLPDDIREWSLSGREKRKKGEAGPAIKRCEKCYAVQRPGLPYCRQCGFEFEVKSRIVEQVEGELSEVDPKMISLKRKREQVMAKTLYDLIQLGRSRGYRYPEQWAENLMRARQRKANHGL